MLRKRGNATSDEYLPCSSAPIRLVSFADVLDQPRAVEALRRALASGRVAHAYLVYGPDGVGKKALALAFAQALLCDRNAPGGDACGVCNGCLKVRKLAHPDLHVVLPLPSDADEDDVKARLARLADEPYAALSPSLRKKDDGAGKQAFHSTERMNEEVRRPMVYQPLEAKHKVAILVDVDVMRPEAANAFLKLLEEPSEGAVFILTTSRTDRVLPTILSRCQPLRLDALADDAVAAALVARAGVPAAEAAVLAPMAGGSMARALELAADPDVATQRELVLRFFRYAFVRKPEQAAVLDDVAALSREGFKRFCDLALHFAHDLVRYRTLGPTAVLANADQRSAVEGFVGNLPHADLHGMVERLEEARSLVERNVSLSLVVRVLAVRLGEAMHYGPCAPVFVPLAA